MPQRPVGGGAAKVLYTLKTVRRMGLGRAAKALRSNNACKACGYGMGGQLGGMTNEQGEYPAVCNKSVQAQSTDVQPAIPDEIFHRHSISQLRELTAKQLEHLGRLGKPIHKGAGDNRFTIVDWERALALAADRLRACPPERSFFYASGRSSNEAGFLFQLFARAFGTNNVTNCSYYCHQATGVGLRSTIGTGTATVELDDLDRCDLIFVIGANPASNHPRFIHKLKACRDRGGQVIMINPALEPGLVKFALPKSPRSMLSGGSDIASHYLQPRIGSDVALLQALAKRVLDLQVAESEFLRRHTTGSERYLAELESLDFPTLLHRCGVSKEALDAVALAYANADSAVFAWGMGVTHHLHGVENVEAIAALALLRGMVGRPGAGLLPLRGHSNVQGIGTIGVKPVLSAEIEQRMASTLGLKLPTARGMDTVEALQAAHDGLMDCAVLMGGNLFGASPDRAWITRALERTGCRISLTTTLNTSHVEATDGAELLVLPVTARDEEWQPTTQESMFNFVRLSDGGIRRLPDVRPEVAILSELAQRALPDSPLDFAAFARHRLLREAIAEIVPGLEDLKDIDVARKEFHVRNRLLHRPEFKTADGKARFPQLTSLDPTPDSGRFRLATVRSEGQFNTMIYQEHDSYRNIPHRWCVLMAEQDIANHGLQAGDRVTLRSDHGVMEDLQVFAFELPAGNLLAYFPEANRLTGIQVDPRSRTPAFKSVEVWLEKPAATRVAAGC
ncbi:MAG: FdhF/YdeP family oxidoreductase [Pseudomonadota bacterium]